ncbi:two-component system sensor histidine kinase AtoS [Sporomusa sp.]|uniref:two-component system sensor histidine kinase AtoS n=1 Tax=Sporomusa sp. TaxID=2078658 RepID=UPI002CA845A7|nr:two-component system sensor histidine kinase AtoS [Sporomusa sp.]HWR45125.1 two-component system sensor histidine kinase AtoS [Sporomusa sp.]
MKRLVPQTLRNKMILFTLIIVSIPILLTGYVIKLETQEALLVEKQTKLFGIALLLDNYLGEGYNEILTAKNARNADRATQIKVLNEALKNYTDTLTNAYPGVGAGYYSKELDAIITYGPSNNYADKVGITIGPTHPGRKVMSTSERLVEFAPMVRGDIMNAMVPVVRHGEVVGYIWANELTDDIHAQMASMDYNIYLSVSIGIIVSLLLIFWMIRGFIHNVETIKNGLEQLRFDLRHRINPMEGEMGQISDAINHMARSLLNAQTLNENIMHSIADGVITVDIDGNITSANKSAEALTGFICSEIVDKPYKEIFCEGRHFNSLLLDTLATGTNYIGIEMDYPVKNGDIYISISTSRLKDSTDKIIGAVVVFKDLTEQHRLQAQMLRAERLASLGELMAGVAHEIRNPLTAIKGFVQYLQGTDNEAERKEYMPVIIKEVDRVNRVIETLLYFARPCKTNYSLVDINGLIEETLVLVKNTGTKHKLEFRLQLDETIPQIKGDAEQLKQVLLNLFINAVQAIPDQGILEIKTWQEYSGFVHVKITDTGNGINPADLSKVFDPFFTTKATGTGLGLAVVQRIINAHYGRVDIQSEIGCGTAVTLQFPVTHQGGEADE